MSKNSKIYPWLVVAMLMFVATLNYLDRQMLATMRPAMMGDISELVSATNFGRLMAVFLWIYAFMSPVSGLIADRINRKWLITGSLLVWSTVTLLMGYAETFNQLYALRALMGVSEALYMPAGLALITDYHQGKTRSLAVGIHLTGVYLGQAFGGFGAVVSSAFSWQTTFHTFGLVGIVYCIVLILFLKEKKTYQVEKQSFKVALSGMGKALGVLLGNISFWVILFYFSAPSLPGWATKNWLPTFFSESLHIEMTQAGPMSTITLAMASLVGVVLGGIIADRWVQKNVRGRVFTGSTGLFLTIPALLFLAFGNSLPAIIAGAIFFGLGFGMFDCNSMPILSQFVSSRYRATGYGIMNFVGISAGAVITNVLGKSVDGGNLQRDFLLMSFVVAAVIVVNLVGLRPKVLDKKDD